MEDDKRLSADPSDFTLLSPATFGPPAYASTALKPEDGRTKQDTSSSVDESLTSREILSTQNKTSTVSSEKINELLGSIKAAHMVASQPSSNDISLDISQVSSNPPSIITDDYSMLSSSQFLMPVIAPATGADSEDIATIPSGSPMPSESEQHISGNTSSSNLTSNSTVSLKNNVSEPLDQGDTVVDQLVSDADSKLDAKLANIIVTQSDSQHGQLKLDTSNDQKILEMNVGGAAVTQWSEATPTTSTTSQIPSQYFKMSSNISTTSETDQTLVITEQQDELSSSFSSLTSQSLHQQQQQLVREQSHHGEPVTTTIAVTTSVTSDDNVAAIISADVTTTVTTSTATAYATLPGQVDASSRLRSTSLPSINLATTLEPMSYRVGSLNNVMLRKQGDGLESNIPVMLTAPSVTSQLLIAIDDQSTTVTSNSSIPMDDRPLLLDGENRSDGSDQIVARTDVSNVLEREGTLVGADSDEEDDSSVSSSAPSESNFLTDDRPYSLLDHQLQFSLFEPSNLEAVISRESLLSSLRPPVTAGQEKMLPSDVNPSLSQALQVTQSIDLLTADSLSVANTQSVNMTTDIPAVTTLATAAVVSRQDVSVTRSDFLHGTSKLSEVERPTAVGFTEWDKSPMATITTVGHSKPDNAIITSSVQHDVVKATSSDDILPYLEPQGILDSEESDSVSTTEPTMDFGNSLDGGELPQGVTDSFGNVKDANSFLKELEQDELLIEQQNATPKVNITSTLANSWGAVSPQNSSELPSIGTYFAEGSDKLGELSTKLSPSERPRFSDTHNVISPAVTAHDEGSSDDDSSSYYSSSSSHDQDTTMIADPALMDNVMTSQVGSPVIGSHNAKLTLTDSTLLLPDLSTVTATASHLVSINSSLLTPQTPSVAHMTVDFNLTSGLTPPLALLPTTTTGVLSSSVAPVVGLSSSSNLKNVDKASSLNSSGSSSLTSEVSSGTSSVGDLLLNGGLQAGGGLTPTSGLNIGNSLLSSTSLIGDGLTANMGLTTAAVLSLSSGLTTGGGLLSSRGIATGGGLLSSSGLMMGGVLSLSSGSTTGGDLLSSSDLKLTGGLSTSNLAAEGELLFANVTAGGGLLPGGGLTHGSLTTGEGLASNNGLSLGGLSAGDLLSSRSLTIGGGVLSGGVFTAGGSLTSGSDLNNEGLLTAGMAEGVPLAARMSSSSSSITISGLPSCSNFGVLPSSKSLTTGGGLLLSGNLITGGVTKKSLDIEDSLLSNRDQPTLSSEQTSIQGVLQSSVSVTAMVTSPSGLISSGSLTPPSGLTSSGSLISASLGKHGIPYTTTGGLLTSGNFYLGSGLMSSSGLSPLKGSTSVGKDSMAGAGLHVDAALSSSGILVTSSGYSPSSGLLTVSGLKLSSGLSPSVTSEIAPSMQHGVSHSQPSAITTTNTAQWPSHVQAILDSSTFDADKFLLSLQTNYGHLTQQVTTAMPAVTTAATANDELTNDVAATSDIVLSSVSSTDSEQEIISDDELVTDDISSQSSLTNVAGSLMSSKVASAVASIVTSSLSISKPTVTTRSSITPTIHHLATVLTLPSTTSVSSLSTSTLASTLYSSSSLISAPHDQLRIITPRLSVVGVTASMSITNTLAGSVNSSSLHMSSLQDLERETSTPTLPITLIPTATTHTSWSKMSYTRSSGDSSNVISSGSVYSLSTSRSAPLSSSYYTPLSASAGVTSSLRVSSSLSKVVCSSGTANVHRQIFPSSNTPSITSPSNSVSRHNVSLVYLSSTSDVAVPSSADVSGVKQLKALHTPSSVTLSKPCCVGDSVQTHIPITNSCERWIQCKAQVIQVYRDNKQVSSEEFSTFMHHPCCYVGPHKTENLKITFAPATEGNYEAVLKIEPSFITAANNEVIITEKIVIKAISEKPQLWVKLGDSGNDDVLTFGEIVVGHSVTVSIELSNYGQADLPIRMVMSTPTQHSGRFSFEDVPVRIQSPRLQLSPNIRPRQVVSLLLPGRQLNSSAEVHKLNVTFSALSDAHLYYGSIPSKPEECSASVIVEVEATTVGAHNHSITTIPMKALIGVVKLVTPTGLQAMSLSCAAGQSVSRSLPLKNSGNLPFTVLLNITGDHFTVQPDTLKLLPQEEAEVFIMYSSGNSSSADGSLKMLVRPGDKCYQIKLRGNTTAVTSSSSGSLKSEGQLLTSAQTVFWGGVAVGSTKMEKFFLENVYKYNVELRLSIKDSRGEFQLQSEALSPSYTSSLMITLPPKAQVPVRLVFTPSSMMLKFSSVELYDLTHNRKFKIKLYGYGGTSHVNVVNSQRSGDAHVISIGEVTTGHRNVAKLIVKNSGPRSAFIKSMCYVDDKMTTALSSQHVSLSPSEFVLPPHVTKEILIIYNASHSDEVKCRSSSNQLAHVILYTGDEAVRTRLRRKMISLEPSSCDLPLVQLFLRDFAEQYLAENNLDLSSVSYKKEERLFEYCLRQLNVVLIGTAAGCHGNYPHIPLRGPITPHHNTVGSHDPPRLLSTMSPYNVEESLTEEVLLDNDGMATGWSVQPKQIILPPRPDRLEDTYKARIQLLNYSDASIRYQLSFAKTHLVITPSQGILKRRSDCLILVSPRISSGSHTHPLPWAGHITVHCNNDTQVIRVQIREDMELQSSSEVDTTGSLSDASPVLAASKSSHSSFLSTRHLIFPSTAVGHYSEQLLAVNNPRPELMQLFIHSESSPTVKSVNNPSAELSRANYAAFWINKKSVSIAALESCQLVVTFMPHNEGEFSQKWIVMFTYGKENAIKVHLTFSGKATKDLTSTTRHRILDEKAVQTSLLAATSPKRRRTDHKTLTDHSDDSTLVTPSPICSLPTRKTITHIPYKAGRVKIETTLLQFPNTRRGESYMMKIKVYNGEDHENKFEVVQPLPPFSVHSKHRRFSLQHKHVAKLPVTFTPQRPKQDYHGILTIRTSAGHQLLAELKGSST